MTKLRTTAAIGVAGIAAALVLTGCGGSSSSVPTPSISIPTEVPTELPTGASINPNGGGVGEKPSGWPADVPVPSTLALQGSGGVASAMTGAWLGDGDVKAVQTELTSAFKNAGFTSTTSFGGGDTGGVTVWTKGGQKVQVTVAQQSGKVAVSETIVNT